MANQIQGLRPDGTLPSVARAEVEQIVADGGGGLPDGVVPIFPTLAEALAWEADNPGKTALTLEPSTPDTTPPTVGVMTVEPEGTSASASVSGASDDRGAVEYAFRLGSGPWSAWQADSGHEFDGLSVSTSYTASWKVRDLAGNESVGFSVPFTTLAEDSWGTAWKDDFTGDGPLAGRPMSHGEGTWQWFDVAEILNDTGARPFTEGGTLRGDGATGFHTETGGVPPAPKHTIQTWLYDYLGRNTTVGLWGGVVQLPETPSRVSMTVRALAGSGNVNNRVGFVLAGSDAGHYTTVIPSADTKWARVDGGVRGTGTTGSITPVTGSNPTYQDEVLWTVNLEGRHLTMLADGTTYIDAELPEEALHGGPFFGVVFNSNNVTAYVDDFTIRWE